MVRAAWRVILYVGCWGVGLAAILLLCLLLDSIPLIYAIGMLVLLALSVRFFGSRIRTESTAVTPRPDHHALRPRISWYGLVLAGVLLGIVGGAPFAAKPRVIATLMCIVIPPIFFTFWQRRRMFSIFPLLVFLLIHATVWFGICELCGRSPWSQEVPSARVLVVPLVGFVIGCAEFIAMLFIWGLADAFSPNEVVIDLSTCPKCLYSLRGLSGSRCPECGFESMEEISREQ